MRRSLKQFLGWWLLIGTALFLPHFVWGQALELRWNGDDIRLAAPKLRFLGSPMQERLQNGAPVPMTFQVTVAADNRSNVMKRVSERFVLSYDLWEEKYAVTLARKGGRPVLHKSAPSAEAWCVDQMSVRVSDLPMGRKLWFRLDVRAEDPEAESGGTGPTTLRGLVDTFSRTRPRPENQWTLEAGPVRLDDLKKPPGERKAARLWASLTMSE
jgi:hypothetical protein